MASSNSPSHSVVGEKKETPVEQYATETELETGETRVDSGNKLKRSLQGRHMQMIAIGGAIGAGLFVGSGSALRTGGPASLVLGFLIVGIMLLCTVQSLGEMAVMFPVNGSFYKYSVRFIDDSWGSAIGWQYAVGWMLTLPYELIAAGVTIQFWNDTINTGVWIAVFMTALIIVQFFGVRGYGEVEFVLAIVKITACIGLIILGIIINTGGVPTDDRGYIGGRYWEDPGAFRNGFKGFCSVFVTAAFAFGGTEMVGLAAAESANPRKSIPKASKQVFWRIAFFYIVNLFILGLNVPSNSEVLLGSSGANTKASPFVLAVELAGIKVLPSIINAVITVSVLSVANSCTYGSTRVLQALAEDGRAPKIFARIDAKGRPVWCIALQLAFGLLAFISEASEGSTVLGWLLSLTGLSNFFIWGSINLSHIRFRAAMKAQGMDDSEIPWKSSFGVWGSYVGLGLNILCLIATFYVGLFPIGAAPSAEAFFGEYLAFPTIIVLFAIFKFTLKDKWGVKLLDCDINTGRRQIELEGLDDEPEKNMPMWKKLLQKVF